MIEGVWYRLLVKPIAAGYIQDKSVDINKTGVVEYSNNETISVVSDKTLVIDSVSIPTTKDTITFYQLQGFDWYKGDIPLDLNFEYGTVDGAGIGGELKIYTAVVQAIN